MLSKYSKYELHNFSAGSLKRHATAVNLKLYTELKYIYIGIL